MYCCKIFCYFFAFSIEKSEILHYNRKDVKLFL